MIRLLVAAAALALLTAGAAADTQTPLAAGAPAPQTTLTDQSGQKVRLADLIKQRDFVVVAFYVKAFTGG